MINPEQDLPPRSRREFFRFFLGIAGIVYGSSAIAELIAREANLPAWREKESLDLAEENDGMKLIKQLTQVEPFTQPLWIYLEFITAHRAESSDPRSDIQISFSRDLGDGNTDFPDEETYRNSSYQDYLTDPKFPRGLQPHLSLQQKLIYFSHESYEVQHRATCPKFMEAGILVDFYSIAHFIQADGELRKAYAEFEDLALEMMGETRFIEPAPTLMLKYSEVTKEFSFSWDLLQNTPAYQFLLMIDSTTKQVMINTDGRPDTPSFTPRDLERLNTLWIAVTALVEEKLRVKMSSVFR